MANQSGRNKLVVPGAENAINQMKGWRGIMRGSFLKSVYEKAPNRVLNSS